MFTDLCQSIAHILHNQGKGKYFQSIILIKNIHLNSFQYENLRVLNIYITYKNMTAIIMLTCVKKGIHVHLFVNKWLIS